MVNGLREKRAVSAPEKNAERQRQMPRIKNLIDVSDNTESPFGE